MKANSSQSIALSPIHIKVEVDVYGAKNSKAYALAQGG
jgi:hypothetical protein